MSDKKDKPVSMSLNDVKGVMWSHVLHGRDETEYLDEMDAKDAKERSERMEQDKEFAGGQNQGDYTKRIVKMANQRDS